MNETLFIYLKQDNPYSEEAEKQIDKMDELLLTVGLKYSGIRNMYIPVDRKKRDDITFDAIRILKKCDWLKGIFDYVAVGNEYYNGDLDKIDCSLMSEPNVDKMSYYDAYYQKHKRLPHAILLDENNRLIDGYISYLLAKKYQIKNGIITNINIYHVEGTIPYKKVVAGRHVSGYRGEPEIKSQKIYQWIYDLKHPVVPGDILCVKTEKGKAYIVVDDIHYIAGCKYCSSYKKVQKHMNSTMEI